MKKMLMVASVASMIGQFNMENIVLLKSMGYRVDVACDFQDRSIWNEGKVDVFKKQLESIHVCYHQIDFSRNICHVLNHIVSYKQLRKLMKENQYEFIHCHTPIAGAISRVAAHKKKVKVVYTAHGFHFFKGAPLKNWLLFYPVEKWLSAYTDILITITKEDHTLACKRFNMRESKYIPGVGIDVDRINTLCSNKAEIREEMRVGEETIVLVSVGELNENKNHEIVIRSLEKLRNYNIVYFICGIGEKEDALKGIIEELKLENVVRLLGFRQDIYDILKMADIYIHPSFREGLSVALMEAMAVGLPVICSDIRGNRDLIDDTGGILVSPNDENEFRIAIGYLIRNHEERAGFGRYNQEKVNEFGLLRVKKLMKQVYQAIGH